MCLNIRSRTLCPTQSHTGAQFGMTILGYSAHRLTVDRNSKKLVVHPVRQERLKDEIDSCPAQD